MLCSGCPNAGPARPLSDTLRLRLERRGGRARDGIQRADLPQGVDELDELVNAGHFKWVCLKMLG